MLLRNADDMQYYGDVVVGGQQLSGIFDTGSFELLVFSQVCHFCGQSNRLYNHNLSNHYSRGNLTKMHSFGSGDTWSREAKDMVQVGSLETANQTFWEVIDTAMPVLQNAAFQAIIGLGPMGGAAEYASRQEAEAQAALEQFKDAETLGSSSSSTKDLEDAKKLTAHAKTTSGLLQNFEVHTFSVCIGQQPGEAGVFTWNDEDPRLRPTVFAEIPVAGSVHWSVKLTDASIGFHGDQSFVSCGQDTGPCGAVLDTGTSLIAAPKAAIEQVEKVLARLGGDCSRIGELPDLRFHLGGKAFSLPPESYVGQVEGDIPTALAELMHFKPPTPRGLQSRRSRRKSRQSARDGHTHQQWQRKRQQQTSSRQKEESRLVEEFISDESISDGFSADASNNQVDSATPLEGSCRPLLMAINASTQFGPMWILGLPFFRRYYTTFYSAPYENAPESAGNAHFDEDATPQKYDNRVFAAVADDNCKPTSEINLINLMSNPKPRRPRIRKVRARDLHVSHWLRHAIKNGKYVL